MNSDIETLKFLENRYYTGIKFGLENTQRMLAYLGNPHHSLRCIHIAGTNGKGSVCAMLHGALVKAGYKTGLYTSPHLISVRERLRINGEPISNAELTTVVNFVDAQARALFNCGDRYPLTFFELLTVMALLYFHQQGVDYLIMEVGLGGRLDSTNVINPCLSVITSIDYDHMNFLGNTLIEIAREKAGIIKPHIPLVCGATQPEVQRCIREAATHCQSTVCMIGHDFDPETWEVANINGKMVQTNKIRWGKRTIYLKTRLLGRHQCANAAIVYAILQQLKKQHPRFPLRRGLAGIHEALWPGRLQSLAHGMIVDAAHNPAGVAVVVTSLKQIFPRKKWRVIFAVLKDKNWREMLDLLIPITKKFFLTSVSHERAESGEAIAAHLAENATSIGYEVCASASEALNKIGIEGDRLAIGSLYLIGEVMAYYNPSPVLPAIIDES